MGCSASKLDDEEAVQLCKDRKNFIKQVIDHRNRFASGHAAYIQSMRRVSLALLHYVMPDDLHEFLSDSYTTPPFTPVKGLSPEIRAPLTFSAPTSNEMVKSGARTVNYLRSGGNQSVVVEEWPEPHETVQFESYYPMENYGMDGFFTSQISPAHRSSFFSSPYNRSSYQSSSPRASSWDYFWNPFSSMDQYGYPSRSSFDRMVNDDDIAELRQVREEEGIPELEEDIDDDHDHDHDHDHGYDRGHAVFRKAEPPRNNTPEVECEHPRVQVGDESPFSGNAEATKVQEVKELKSEGSQSIRASEEQNAAELEIPNQRQVAGNSIVEETPGFTVYVNRRPASMAEVMKDMENQFIRICDCANEISVMLETSRAHYSSSSNELAALRMLNPVALFRSSSSCSSSSKFFHASSSSKGDADEGSSDYSEECCMASGSHKSTLDRLYAWEKKLYDEVKSGERVRIAYEKKCIQLRNHDVNGDEPSVVDKTRAAIRDLHTRLKISIHTVQSISKRIEALRDGELYPQLMEMIQGLRRMWKTMADCHLIQKRTIDEAKLLLFSNAAAAATPLKSPRPAANLAAELRNWRSSFAAWIDAQRSYARALACWASRCAPVKAVEASENRKALSPVSQLRAGGEGGGTTPEVVMVCGRWSRLVESVSEERVVDGMDFFAAGMASVSAQQREAVEGEGAAGAAAVVEEVGPRVLCAGFSVAVGSLAELAVVSAEGYDAVVRRCGGGVPAEA